MNTDEARNILKRIHAATYDHCVSTKVFAEIGDCVNELHELLTEDEQQREDARARSKESE